jgi:hypothetical protein
MEMIVYRSIGLNDFEYIHRFELKYLRVSVVKMRIPQTSERMIGQTEEYHRHLTSIIWKVPARHGSRNDSQGNYAILLF